MKSKIRKKVTKLGLRGLFAFVILIILTLPSFFIWNLPLNNRLGELKDLESKLRVKSSVIQLASFYIDDTNPSNNWEAFAAYHIGDFWFTDATGTEFDPYIIGNITTTIRVDHITIINSEAHFIILNFEVTNWNYLSQGLYMQNVSNGRIMNSNFTNYLGMSVTDTNSSFITGNTFSRCETNGINLFNSHNNTLFNNTFDSNLDNGLYIHHSNDNTIRSNTFKNHGHLNYDGSRVEDGAGIIVRFDSYYNKIAENIFTNNMLCGLELELDSGNTTVIDNEFDNNDMCAIILSDTTNNTIRDNIMTNNGILFDGIWDNIASTEISSTNLVDNKPVYFYNNKSNIAPIFFLLAGQVFLINCSNSVIPSLSLNPGSVGFTLIHCKNITLLNCKASNNKLLGIHLIECTNITISGCITNNNGDCGILLEDCNNTKILDSEASYNDILIRYWAGYNYYGQQIGCGIALENGIDNLITESHIQSNNVSGIFLESSHQTNISKNVFTDNKLYIISHHNVISENYFENRISVLEFYHASYNLITKNNFNKVRDAIQLSESAHNDIIENKIVGDGGIGIEFRTSSYNNIIRNKISGVEKCFLEYMDSESNVFTDNECEDIPFKIIVITFIIVLIGVTAVLIILAIVFIRRRKRRKS